MIFLVSFMLGLVLASFMEADEDQVPYGIQETGQ